MGDFTDCKHQAHCFSKLIKCLSKLDLRRTLMLKTHSADSPLLILVAIYFAIKSPQGNSNSASRKLAVMSIVLSKGSLNTGSGQDTTRVLFVAFLWTLSGHFSNTGGCTSIKMKTCNQCLK